MQITDHHITLLYFINKKVDTTQFTFKTLTKTGLPQALQNKWIANQRSKFSNKQIWQQKDDYNISRNLLPAIHKQFHTELITTFKLNEDALSLINGEKINSPENQKPSYPLTLQCNNDAKKRLRKMQCEELPEIKMLEVLFHQFATGTGIISIDLQLQNENLSDTLINEVVYQLAKINKLYWQNTKNENKNEQTLGLLIRQLVDDESTFKKTRRVYTHSYIQYKKDENNEKSIKKITTTKEIDMLRMARHYSLAYSINNNMVNEVAVFRTYDNIRHCIASEGTSCIVIIDKNTKEFVLDYYSKALKQAHIVLFKLAFHAQSSIQNILDIETNWIGNKTVNPKELADFQFNQKQLEMLEHHFFHSTVSYIDEHNKIHNDLIKINQLKKQHKKASALTQKSINMIFDYQNQEKQKVEKLKLEVEKIKKEEAKKSRIAYCKIAKIGIAIASVPTSYSFFHEFLDDKSAMANISILILSLTVAFAIYCEIRGFCNKMDDS